MSCTNVNTASLPIGNGISLLVETDFPTKQFTISAKDRNGNYQDLALVRPAEGGNGYTVLVWADATEEDFTHEFHIFPTKFKN